MEANKYNKLIKVIDSLVKDLHVHRDLKVHAEINQFFYMQKVTELQVIQEQIKLAEEHFELKKKLFEKTYQEVSCRWCKDARWLNQYVVGKLPGNKSGSELSITKSILVL